MAEILHQLIIEVPPPATFDAVSQQKGLSSWWTTDAKAEPIVGSIAEFGFNDRAIVFDMRVVALDKPNFVRWHCLAGHPEWCNTDLIFALSSRKGGTLLRFAHRGWSRAMGSGSVQLRLGEYLTSLKEYLETGTGSPHGSNTATE